MRRIAAVVCFLAALACGAVLAVAALAVRGDPQPYHYREQYRHILVDVRVPRTRIAFPGDCVQIRWYIYGVQAIYLNDHPFLGTGERNLCDGTSPTFRIALTAGKTLIIVVPRVTLFDTPLACMLVFGVILLSLGGAALVRVNFDALVRSRAWVEYAVVFGGACVLIVVLDLFTNSLDYVKYTWDHVHYIEMAQYGIGRDFQGLVAPYAYRPATPLLAGVLGERIGRSVIAGFRVVAYVGAVSQLTLVYALARQFTPRFVSALAAVGVTAFSLFNVKFLLFDIFRPDHLAFALLVLALLALWRRWYGVCIVVSSFGLLVREFLILPLALLALTCAVEGWRTRQVRSLIWLGVTLAAASAAIILPRVLIVVARSSQLVDQNTLIDSLLDMNRNLNILFVYFSYLLPTLLLATPARLRRAWAALRAYPEQAPDARLSLRASLIFYTLGVTALTFYGGTDVMRFAPYLFIPQTVLIALWAEDAHPLELIYLLAAVFIFNRVLLNVPMENLQAYYDFYGGWNNRVNDATLARTLEGVVYLLGVWLLRGLILYGRFAFGPKLMNLPIRKDRNRLVSS